nr:hypothetical protein [Oryza sativa Japonica Group]ABF96212.1 hypothetical protein LOC_Os03g25830 [Oryza sativa Japonica Group]
MEPKLGQSCNSGRSQSGEGGQMGNPPSAKDDAEAAARKMEDDFNAFTVSKADDLAKPLKDAGIPYKIHISAVCPSPSAALPSPTRGGGR